MNHYLMRVTEIVAIEGAEPIDSSVGRNAIGISLGAEVEARIRIAARQSSIK